MKYLPPLVLQDAYFDGIESRINEIFDNAIFKPLLDILRKNSLTVENSTSSLDAAVRSIKRGKIYFDGGFIKGDFSSRVSKSLLRAGAKYSARAKGWVFEGAIPAELQIAIAQAEAKTSVLQSNIVRALDSVDVDKAIRDHPLSEAYSETIGMMNVDFQDNVRAAVAIPLKMTDQARQSISQSWANNLDLYIKGWADEAILKLRSKVMDNAMRGQRSANMAKSIMEEYGVSRRKAKFLARQETALLMSKFQEERYKDIGITKYRWSGSMDKRERHDHKLLEGKIISWDSPPITNRKTGARNHAGQDFGCRCVAIPILESAV